MVSINLTCTGKVQNYHHLGPSKFQNALNEIQSIATFIVQKGKFMKADYPLRFIKRVINEFQKRGFLF